jgi:anti-sigma factor RsiW
MTDPADDLLASLPRHRAPAELRAAIVRAARAEREPAGRWWWWAPAVSAAATALAMALLWISVLPRVLPADPLQRLVRSVVSEHTRNLIWGEPNPDVVPAALPWLAQETGIGLARVFVGDHELRLIAGEPVYLEGRRGVALHYRDVDEHLISYVVLPAPGIAVPVRGRIQIDRFRPALTRADGFALLVWKHGDLACFLVSDMVSAADLERFKTYFLRIRQTSEPYSAQ